MATISWSELRATAESGPKPVPAGKYEAIAERVNVKETKSGKTMFGVMFRIVAGPENGSTIWTNLVVSPDSPRALGILFQQFDAMGLTSTFFAENPSDEQIAAALENARATITVKIGEWDGMPRPEVNRIERSNLAANPTLSPAAPAPSGEPGTPPAMPF